MSDQSLSSRTFSTRRVEALTDGVFAIAMTLLVLDLNVSDFTHIHTSQQLWHSIWSLRTNIISFVVSFLLLGNMWAVHTRQFEYIKRADRHLVNLNTYRLLAVVIMPLTTSISATYDSVVLGRAALAVNFFVITALSAWQWIYAASQPDLITSDVSDKYKEYYKQRNLSIVWLSAGFVVLALLIGNLAALIFAVPPLIAIFNRILTAQG